MASVKTPLLRKLKKVLATEFPSPATVRLEDHDGIVGVITSKAFAGIDSLERQNLIGQIIDKHLSREESRHVQLIVGVTPDEGTGYLASDQ